MPAERFEIIADPSSPAAGRRLWWLVFVAASVAGALAAIAYAHVGLTLGHYDARSHLVVARRVVDNLTPGWRQIGALWLPLPHLLNLIPVQWDWNYRTGCSAVVLSVLSLSCGLASLARYLVRRTGSGVVAIVAVAL